nr:vesicle transport protein got1 [Quercus suber]
MVSFEMNDRKKIGLGLTGFGVFFSFLGIIFFFDKGLLAMGNILFFSGVTLTIGPKSTMQFFMKRQNFKGTISFGVGFFFVVIGWPIVGMILESYGFIVLFSGFWPTLAVFLQRIPILGWLIQQPYIRSFFDRFQKSCREAQLVYVTGSEVVSDLTTLVHVPIFKLPLIVCSSDL